MSFINKFISNGDISFNGLRNVALEELSGYSKIKLDQLYEDLDRGTGVLDDEDHLNMYLRSFGKMHQEKLKEAFSYLPNLLDIQGEDFEIFDWGCGQGTATICMLDYLSQNAPVNSLKKITYIDPSKAATIRAWEVSGCYEMSINWEKKIVTKGFDNLTQDDITPECKVRLHLFSNILDVAFFDLPSFIRLFQSTFSQGSDYFICVGPYYYNNRRVDDFMTAIDPDIVTTSYNKQKGEWKNEWTISLRMFSKSFTEIEQVDKIKRRIAEAQKQQQYHAGYILDEIAEALKKLSTQKNSVAERLANYLCSFDVRASRPLDVPNNIDSKWTVLHNMVVRGLPTIAPLMLQDIFNESFNSSLKPESSNPSIHYGINNIDPEKVYEALHTIDPRFSIENYNGDMLESGFEKNFIEKKLKGSSSEHLIQLLEPQRKLSTIIRLPDNRFKHDQRVDFALELPCGSEDEQPVGFILEIDGDAYHSNIFQRMYDESRDSAAARNNWDTYRLRESQEHSFLSNWEYETSRNSSVNNYLQCIKRNYQKKIEGEWAKYLQLVLSPLAVARIEKVIIQAVLNGTLDAAAEKWNIIVIERDVPCAVMAIKHLKQAHYHICQLAGEQCHFPDVSLDIVSTKEFKDSTLHDGCRVLTNIPTKKYDLCIDISMLLRDKIDALANTADADTYYLVRTSHYNKCDRQIYSACSIRYKPLVEKNSRGEFKELNEPKEHLTFFLQEIFRKRGFRKGQLPILSRSLSNKTTIGLLPTGGGKSLTYQLSSMMQPGVTMIIDPLISLMVDQFRGLRDIRIDASQCVNSTMNREQRTRNLNLMQNGSLIFIFLSPERFMMEDFRTNLLAMSRRNNVYFSYGVIDEVHCVSEWGHDFRTSYLHLGRNMINFMLTKSGAPVPVIGLTATASFDVLADVERELTLGGNLSLDSESIVRPESDTRPELTYKIIGLKSSFISLKISNDSYDLRPGISQWSIKDEISKCKRNALIELLDKIPEDLENINTSDDGKACRIEDFSKDDFYSPDNSGHYNNAGIVFCPHATGAFGVNRTAFGDHPGISDELIANESERLEIGTFVGGDNPTEDMASFNRNEQNLMVATKAFGMGIDKPNIRYTINLNHPSSIESYVQEAGRAGRDRCNAISYLLYEPTEYIYLTLDKINDIAALALGVKEFPNWLWNLRGKYALKTDFQNLLIFNGASTEDAQKSYDYCCENGLFDNVDKDIQLWFHNNSFRGLFKEKVIIHEMTDCILNTRPTNLLTIQNRVRESLGNEDIVLQLNTNRNSITVRSEEDFEKQYGYLFLDNLRPTFHYANFDMPLCHQVLRALIQELSELEDHSCAWLSRPIEGAEVEQQGIYLAMQSMGDSQFAYVTVTWTNQIDQDDSQFESNIKSAITEIANEQGWKNIGDVNLSLNKIKEFDELLDKISRFSNDSRWITHHLQEDKYAPLRRAFCRKRDKDDTDKAIYRMCCVGLVEDVTIDYNLHTYQLKIRKRTDEEYLQCMFDFFKKYYSAEQAAEKVEEIKTHKGRNVLDKCLGYLTDFVYQNLERKRFRAIDDMRLACQEGISKGEKWLKEFIYLYFNSKYARDDYRVDETDYSLKKDTDRNREDFDIVRKYIDIISKDSSGSQMENVKHLYGATLLILRAHPENAALNLLRTFCITFLGIGDNDSLKHEAITGYVEGFYRLYESLKVRTSSLLDFIDEFNSNLKYVDDTKLYDEIQARGKDLVMLNIHNQWLNNFSEKYCKQLNN